MRERSLVRVFALVMLTVAACGNDGTSAARGSSAEPTAEPTTKALRAGSQRMSSGGQLARQARHRIAAQLGLGAAKPGGECEEEEEECEGEEGGPADPDGVALGIQSETAIAVSADGQNIVIGFNDFRGFLTPITVPLSISGFMYSHDGGATFVDGGQLPVTTEVTDLGGGNLVPQVFGDPDVKNVGGCNFVYSSIVLAKFGATAVQTMGVHRSTDCGVTWEGPFEVLPATNPNGVVDPNGEPFDAADKEQMDSNLSSGRVLLTWTNFTPFAVGFQEMSSTFSDDLFTATPPTWHSRAVFSAAVEDGQASFPRFGRGTKDAFVAWSQSSGGLGITAFASSKDGGETWGTPIRVSGLFFPNDQVLGNDRIHSFPSVGVDRRKNGRNAGNIYVSWAGNDNQDGADIYFARSTDGGKTFSAPLLLNSRPGDDSAQWFPAMAVDDDTGRVFVFYYDQQIAPTGDLTEATVTWSDDGGRNWTAPQPLKSSTERPWHAGWGNDTSQPNLGDYNMAVVKKNTLYTSFASTFQQLFTDGQPDPFFNVPITDHRRLRPGEQRAAATVSLGDVTATDSGGNGFLDPGETAQLTLPLRNYVTNPLNARSIPLLIATVSSPTPGVTVTVPATIYINIGAGATQNNLIKIRLKLADSFVPGTDIEIRLDAIDIARFPFATVTLLSTLHTGTPSPTLLLAENFDAAVPPALPAGWLSAHGAGANIVRWATSNTFCGGSNAAFHVNANDGPVGGSPARWERLISPAFAVPANAQYVVVEFDVCTDTEDDPSFNILAYDGVFLRVTDLTAGNLVRSNLAEAFANEFTTGGFNHYPKHFPRNNEAGYFPQGDMSAWSGDSGGPQHVRMRLPGMAGTVAQLRFEYTQDGSATCADVRPGHSCGVLIDNVSVTSVVAQPQQ